MTDEAKTTGSDPNRRRARRYAAAVPFHVDGSQARLKNFSATGVGFTTKAPLKPGDTVAVGVRHLPDEKHPSGCIAEVVRVQETESGFSIGAKLEKPLDL